jgi:uncharacterized protein
VPSRARLAVLLLLLGAAAAPAALPLPPPPDRRVNDYAGALAPAERARLERKLAERERGSANQVVVAVFRSLQGENLEDYSIRLAQSWRIGRRGLDNGVIFLVFLEDRKMRIEVGYGLEAALTDAVAASILREVVAPRFRAGRLADGIEAGIDAIGQAIAGTYRPPAPRPAAGPRLGPVELALFLFVAGALATVVVPVLFAQRRRRRRGWTGGAAGWGEPVYWMGLPASRGGGVEVPGGGDFSPGGGGFGGGGASGSW